MRYNDERTEASNAEVSSIRERTMVEPHRFLNRNRYFEKITRSLSWRSRIGEAAALKRTAALRMCSFLVSF